MNKLKGMLEAFKESKQVLLTTKSPDGETRTRAMTNFNNSPYEPMWFASFKETHKVEDIKANPKVVVSFPAKEEGKWYRIKGEARLAKWEEVRTMWRWWLLEWLPEEDRRPLRYDDPFLDRSIIWVEPIEATIGDDKQG
jgi:general stress protein 26